MGINILNITDAIVNDCGGLDFYELPFTQMETLP